MAAASQSTLRICFFGTYTIAEGYPVNRVLLKGLNRAGVTVEECREELWGGFLHELVARPRLTAVLSLCWRLPLCCARLVVRYMTVREHRWVVVGYPGYLDVLLARALNWRRRRHIALVAFISLYDTAVLDRGRIGAGSWKGRLLKALDRISFAAADVVLVDTDVHRQHFAELFRLPPGKFRRSFVGEDDDQFNPAAGAAAAAASELTFEALFFGTYVPLHGIEVILDAAEQLLQEGNIHITVVGNGQLFPIIREDATRRGLANILFIDHWVATSELVEHIGRAHVCLGIFGRTDKAARVIPYKVFDALAMRKPVVTRDSPAVRELLVHGESALLCQPEGPSLARALLRLRDEPGLASRLAQNGYECYRQHGCPEAVGRAFVGSLQEVAA